MLYHSILQQSFALIDQEVGPHQLSREEYAIARRIIHSTADFEFLHLLHCSPTAISAGIQALRQGTPIVTDVTMLRQGIQTLVAKTFQNPVIAAIDLAPQASRGKTRTETGLRRCLTTYPQAIYAIGNAPTALLALCDWLQQGPPCPPALVIGAPVGFVSVVESKQALAQLSIPQIRLDGRKGGSSATAAIINALLVLSYEKGASP